MYAALSGCSAKLHAKRTRESSRVSHECGTAHATTEPGSRKPEVWGRLRQADPWYAFIAIAPPSGARNEECKAIFLATPHSTRAPAQRLSAALRAPVKHEVEDAVGVEIEAADEGLERDDDVGR